MLIKRKIRIYAAPAVKRLRGYVEAVMESNPKQIDFMYNVCTRDWLKSNVLSPRRASRCHTLTTSTWMAYLYLQTFNLYGSLNRDFIDMIWPGGDMICRLTAKTSRTKYVKWNLCLILQHQKHKTLRHVALMLGQRRRTKQHYFNVSYLLWALLSRT